MEDEDHEEITGTVIIGIIIVIFLIIVGALTYHEVRKYQKIQTLKTECAKNPRLLYNQSCTSKEECTKKCAEQKYEDT